MPRLLVKDPVDKTKYKNDRFPKKFSIGFDSRTLLRTPLPNKEVWWEQRLEVVAPWQRQIPNVTRKATMRHALNNTCKSLAAFPRRRGGGVYKGDKENQHALASTDTSLAHRNRSI